MIKVFANQTEYEAWLGDNILPSKIIAFLQLMNKYIVHTNNAGEDVIYEDSFEGFTASGVLPLAIYQEIEVFDNNLNPIVPPGPTPTGDTYTKEQIDAKDTNVYNNSKLYADQMDQVIEGRITTAEGRITSIEDQVGNINTSLQNILGDE